MAEELGYSTPDTPAKPAEKAPARDEKAFLKQARERFKLAQDADKAQRQRELEDLRFYAGDQWPEEIKAARAGQNASNGLPPVPARPCLTINKTREPVRQVLNQERQSDMGIEIVPADDFGELVGPIDDTEIKLREGLVRRIQRDSKAADARTWAFARATIAGRGYYGVLTRYVPGKTNDQEVYIHRFYNQASVTLDPAHEQPDGSDAEWAFVGTDMPLDQYKAEFPKAKLSNLSDDELRALGENLPDWVTVDGEQRSCRVVDYWRTERTTRSLCTLQDGSVEWEDELPSGAVVTDRRDVIEKQIKWSKIDAIQILDETDWPGPDLPIVKVLGEELQPYDKERRAEGMVRPMREPGQGYNAMVSKWVESVALAPIPPIMVAEGQVEGYEAWYQAANTRTLPYLPYKTVDLEMRPAPPPFATPRDVPLQHIAASVQLFDEAIQSTSGQHDPSLGKVDPSVKSGRAIQALQQQSQRSSNHFLDNLARSIRYEGQIINNLLYAIYGRPGRMARLINGDGEAETVLVHQPFTMQGSKPVPVPGVPPVQPGQPAPQSPALPPNAKTYTLTKDAQFNVIVKVSKSFDSRREQEASIVGDLLSAAPMLMTWFGDLFFKNQDGPGHQEMADRAKVMLDPKIQQMLEGQKQGVDIPPAVQAQMAQMGQALQQTQAQLQQAGQIIQTEQQKYDAQIKTEQIKAKLELDTAIAVAKVNNAAKIEIARITAAKQGADIAQEAAEERLATGLEQSHEVALTAMQNLHEQQMAGQAQAHQAEVAQQGRAAQADQQASDQAHQAQMAEQQQQAAAEQAAQQPAGGGQ